MNFHSSFLLVAKYLKNKVEKLEQYKEQKVQAEKIIEEKNLGQFSFQIRFSSF